MILTAGELTLRPWRKGDEEALVRLADDPAVSANLRDRFPSPYTLEDARTWVAHCEAQRGPTHDFALEVGGALVGGAGLEKQGDIHRQTVELGYWLGRAHWGRGLATAAATALAGYALEELGYARVQAEVFEWNPASARVLEKAGFALEARLRRHVTKAGRLGDALLYARVR